MAQAARSVLYVRLPCWKIYPGGVVYVADYVHKQRPDVTQHILDLALVPPRQRRRMLAEHIERLAPDVVAFSWRNMQSFGPHAEDDAMNPAITWDYSRSLWRRLRAVKQAVRMISDYIGGRLRNFALFRLTRRLAPAARIVVGGGAVSIFGRYVIEHCPPDTVAVIGEGEDAMLSIVDGAETPAGEYFRKGADGRVTHGDRAGVFDLARLTAVNFDYIASIFPDFTEYRDSDVGVNTKRGCPFQCQFCLYTKIEGARQRYRDPEEVAKEVDALVRDWGVKRVWFTDAQFCSTLKSTRHVEQILDAMLARETRVTWLGYVRLDHLTPALARKMWASGMGSVDLTFTGSQEMIDQLTLGYSLERQMTAFRMLRDNGHTNQPIKLYLPLNAPGETVRTLEMTIERIEELYRMFGRDNVLPFIFFIGIQPGTPVEKRLIDEGYLKAGWDPLTLNPFVIKKLLYNPKPLGPVIARAYLEAAGTTDACGDYIGRATIDVLVRALREPAVVRLGATQKMPVRPRREAGAHPAPVFTEQGTD